MDSGGMESLNIIHILPELEVGGVESHVLALSSAQLEEGHKVMVISGGGRMVSSLHRDVTYRELPVYKKNPLTGLYCALRIASWVKSEGWEIIHSHSRVPSWIAWWASSISSIPFVVTCHALYSQNKGLIPYRHADGAISVSKSVENHLVHFLPEKKVVINNGIEDKGMRWKGPRQDGLVRFLFVGRLTKIKGIEFLIDLLCEEFAHVDGWVLDVVGEGPLLEKLQLAVRRYSLDDKIIFRGYRKNVEDFMVRASCMLFPSYGEGYPLTLAQAIKIEVPILASDIEPIMDMKESGDLPGVGAKDDWSEVIGNFIYSRKIKHIKWKEILSVSNMMNATVDFYRLILVRRN